MAMANKPRCSSHCDG